MFLITRESKYITLFSATRHRGLNSVLNITDQPHKRTDTVVDDRIYKVRISAGGGWSYRIAPILQTLPAGFRKYVEDLMSGNNFAIDFSYFVKKDLGIGAKYNSFFSSNYMDNVMITYANGTTQVGRMEDHITISFFGPSLIVINSITNKSVLYYAMFSIGSLKYVDDATVVGNKIMIRASSWGIAASAGIDFLLEKNLALGIEGSGILGSFREVTVNGKKITLQPKEYENVSRVDFSVGLKVYL